MNHCVVEVTSSPQKIWQDTNGNRIFEELTAAEEFREHLTDMYGSLKREFIVHTLIPR